MGQDLEDFENTMLYSLVEYEGKKLFFSVAREYHVRTEGQFYKDVLQIADNEMYANKKYLKEKYNMEGRLKRLFLKKCSRHSIHSSSNI